MHTYQDLLWDRMKNTYQSGKISVDYGYENGMLASIARGGYITAGGAKQTQAYRFTYDEFENRKTAAVTDESGNEANVLATYSYSSDFENLEKMTYGPSDAVTATVFYSYDLLDRVKSVTYDNDNEADVTYGYRYSSDGSWC